MAYAEQVERRGPAVDLVSIVLPTYNGARLLQQAIESCLLQTHANLELIVVVDASTDSTEQILQAVNDPRLRIVRHAHNQGLPAALNSGFAEARGEYLTWTSDDNCYLPGALERMLLCLRQHPDIAFVYANFHRIDDQGVSLEKVTLGPPQELLDHNCIGCCFLYRREVYRMLGGYNPEARLAEDLEYWLRVYSRFQMMQLPEDLYAYRVHNTSLTNTSYNRYEALRVAARARRRVLRSGWRRYADQMAQAYVEEGFARLAQADLGGAQSALWRALRYNPTWLSNRGVRAILVRALAQPGRAGEQPNRDQP